MVSRYPPTANPNQRLLIPPKGPQVTGISPDVPAGCTIDQFAFFSRHGSRYPDRGAYNEWTNLHSRIQAAGSFNVTDPDLAFLSSWEPVLTNPDQQIAQISTTGYKELYDMGATYRLRYSHLYEYNADFTLWANYYTSSSRVRDSARLFARGFLGPNATELGSIIALNASDPRSFLNSLAPSDLCPNYKDEGGSPYKDVWDNTYLPPIQRRLNTLLQASSSPFNFTQADVNIIPYLCGFETQITGRRSPWCSLFTDAEILQYEYAQDLRYWYGNGLGTDVEKYLMLPVLDGLVQRFVDGLETASPNATFVPPNVLASFSNDGQINQLIAALGVFDNEPALPANRSLPNRRFVSSRLVPMRGTVAFERLSCASSTPAPGYGNTTDAANTEAYIRILLNDVVYPVANCTSGPGSSCPLPQYQRLVKKKVAEAGDLYSLCNVTDPAVPRNQTRASFFENVDLPYVSVVRP